MSASRLSTIERDLLAPAGFRWVRQRGSHHTYRHAETGRTVTLATRHGGATCDYSRGEVRRIRREAERAATPATTAAHRRNAA